jgi:hypothetical protein
MNLLDFVAAIVETRDPVGAPYATPSAAAPLSLRVLPLRILAPHRIEMSEEWTQPVWVHAGLPAGVSPAPGSVARLRRSDIHQTFDLVPRYAHPLEFLLASEPVAVLLNALWATRLMRRWLPGEEILARSLLRRLCDHSDARVRREASELVSGPLADRTPYETLATIPWVE